MLDRMDERVSRLDALRAVLADKPPGLAVLFDIGERIATVPHEGGGGWPVQRIAVAGALTTDFIARTIACAAVLEGVQPVVYEAPFGSYVQEILDPSSGLHRFDADVVVLAPDWRDLVEELAPGTPGAEVAARLGAKVALFRHLWSLMRTGNRRIIQHRLVPPARRYRGLAERLLPSAIAAQVDWLNDRLFEAGRGQVTWVEVDALAAEVGTRGFAPAKFHHNARLAFDNRHLPAYLPFFRAAWRSASGQGKKVLALDLDNTLWGGVIGDDGVDGIVLGPGSPAGAAFAEWQGYIAALRGRGVVLAACSKNDPAIAATGLGHPHSRLARADFPGFACSWDDKVTGLRGLARDLNLGLDSFVFCDDNPAECDLVRRELPEVAVIHLGADPTKFIDLLDAGHWFDQQAYTSEDLGRGGMYAARAEAIAEQHAAPDVGAYLRGLEMRGGLFRPEGADLERVAQLELKTNQFNLTTRRYGAAAIAGFLGRPDAVVLAFRLADRFGDHGLTSTLIALHEGDTLRIDSWLMSCRIFSRTAEHFILRGLLDVAGERGATRILGEYRATAKNAVVADLYARLGFSPTDDPAMFARDIDAGLWPDIESAITSD